MKTFLFSLIWFLAAVSIQAADPKEPRHYVLYAQFLDSTPVELSTGARWMMDKGDCFPVDQFKQQQTKVILKLDTATFSTEANKVRIMKDSEAAAALQSYKKNVAEFLKSQTEHEKKDSSATKKDKTP